jgi:solute carrier family 31 (copper transporter), member 1
MLWNWYTVDSCFISSSWHITSSGMSAGSRIGVILLVMSLEMMRRMVKEYDSYIIRKHAASFKKIRVAAAAATTTNVVAVSDAGSARMDNAPGISIGLRPTLLEQAVRALLHMIQFAVA